MIGQLKALMTSVVVPVQALASVAVIVALPMAVGEPVITPVAELMLKPAGSPVAVQV
jgi:hypothetical protein